MKKFFFIPILSALFYYSAAQLAYYATDTSIVTGVKLFADRDEMNSKYCQVMVGDENMVFYTPYEITEYGFQDGRKFFSREIQLRDSVKKVFLELLTEGTSNLYYYKDRNNKYFFLEKESGQLIMIPGRGKAYNTGNYKNFLKEYTADCPSISAVSKLVSYNKASMTTYLERYNNLDSHSYFPHLRFGIIMGVNAKKLILSETFIQHNYYNSLNYNSNFNSMVVGLYLDKPLFMSSFSLHAELSYASHNISYVEYPEKFEARISSVDFPVMLRFSALNRKLSPFINSGVVINYNSIDAGEPEIHLISKYQAGYAVGGGFDFQPKIRRICFLELRYTRLYSLAWAETFEMSTVQLTFGINF